MNHLPLNDIMAGEDDPGAALRGVRAGVLPEGRVRIRSVHRAIAEFRRGAAVVISGRSNLVTLPAETAGADGIADLATLAGGSAAGGSGLLVLGAARAAAIRRGSARPPPGGDSRAGAGGDPGLAFLRLAPDLLTPAALLSLADPTVEQLLPRIPEFVESTPDGADAAVALAKLARLLPAVLVGQLAPDGRARAASRDLLSVDADDILAYPHTATATLRRAAEARVPLEGAPDARIIAFRAADAGIEHLAIVIGRLDSPQTSGQPLLVRVHSECFTGDLLGSLRCDCGAQLRGAMLRMSQEGAGVLLYLAQEGRGIGLVNKLRAYALQDSGLDTVDANHALGWAADERNFMIAATMLEALGVHTVRLLTNNPDKVAALAACGVKVVRREALLIAPNGVNDSYLGTKAVRFGHYLG